MLRIRRHKNRRKMPLRQAGQQFKAVAVAQLDVEEDQVGLGVQDEGAARRTARRGAQAFKCGADGLHEHPDAFAGMRLVVNDDVFHTIGCMDSSEKNSTTFVPCGCLSVM